MLDTAHSELKAVRIEMEKKLAGRATAVAAADSAALTKAQERVAELENTVKLKNKSLSDLQRSALALGRRKITSAETGKTMLGSVAEWRDDLLAKLKERDALLEVRSPRLRFSLCVSLCLAPGSSLSCPRLTAACVAPRHRCVLSHRCIPSLGALAVCKHGMA